VYPASSLYMSTDYVSKHSDNVQKLVNAFVQSMHFISSHTPAEIADKMPADYYKGVGKDAYIAALQSEKGIYTADGLMPADGPQTVLNVLSAFNTDVKGHNIDLAKTYTNDFATKANQTVK